MDELDEVNINDKCCSRKIKEQLGKAELSFATLGFLWPELIRPFFGDGRDHHLRMVTILHLTHGSTQPVQW